MARTDLLGKLGSRAAPLANAVAAQPGSLVRKVMEKATGVSSARLLPPFARQRFSTWFAQAAAGPPHGAAGHGRSVPHLPRRVPQPGHRPGPGEGVRAERRGVRLTDGVGCCGAPWLHSGDLDALHEGGGQERQGVGGSGQDRPRHRRAPADVQLRAAQGLPRLRRRARCRARGRAHLRRLRVPDAAAQGRGHRARHGLPGRRAARDRLPHRLPPPGTEHRSEEPGSHEAHRGQDQAGAAVLRHRRHVGPAGRERRALDPDRPEAGRRARAGRRGHRGRRLPPGQHRHHRADRPGAAAPAADRRPRLRLPARGPRGDCSPRGAAEQHGATPQRV